MSDEEVTSHGHKLGQMIGDFLELIFARKLVSFAKEHNVYCDKKGLRPLVRGERKKVTWIDSKGNKHDLDYVIEKNGSESIKGEPIAFIELCWRRYTKHSRNKAGEIEGSLVHLGATYYRTCTLLGAILVGEFTNGAIKQMQSRKIEVLHIPYEKIVSVFKTKNINLDYSEDASDAQKLELVNAIQKLSEKEMQEVEETFLSSIEDNYRNFTNKLEIAISRKVELIRVFRLFGDQVTFDSVASAIKSIEEFPTDPHMEKFQRFEIYVRFTNGDKVEASFKERKDAVTFLKQFA